LALLRNASTFGFILLFVMVCYFNLLTGAMGPSRAAPMPA
jgi:hypothetical protein